MLFQINIWTRKNTEHSVDNNSKQNQEQFGWLAGLWRRQAGRKAGAVVDGAFLGAQEGRQAVSVVVGAFLGAQEVRQAVSVVVGEGRQEGAVVVGAVLGTGEGR